MEKTGIRELLNSPIPYGRTCLTRAGERSGAISAWTASPAAIGASVRGARGPFNSLSTRLPIEVSGVEAPQQCEDFVKSMKPGGLGGHGGISFSTIR